MAARNPRKPYGEAQRHHRAAADLQRQGQAMPALRHRFEAYRLAPQEPAYRRALAAALRTVRLETASPPVFASLARLLAADDIEPQDLAPLCWRLLAGHPGWQALAGSALDAAPARALLREPLLHAVLIHTLVAEADLEAVLTAVRRACLYAADAGAPPGWLAEAADFLAALACQAWRTEYLWPVDPAEARRVAALRQRLEDAPPQAGDIRLLAYALYAPITPLVGPTAATAGGPAAVLLRRQRDEPAAEHAIAQVLPRLTPIADPVSQAVQAQYEEHPYPRWTATARQAPRPLAEVVRGLFPDLDPAGLPATPTPRVLVAGCGTGAHAVKVASRYAGARVLAVDLSRASLAYAQRQAGALGLDAIRFAQADILGLGELDERFALIECSGVLHHLADPEAGWRVLSGLLAPGGLMKVGLYSQAARRAIDAARALVAERGWPPTLEGMRAARAAIRALPAAHPAASVADELDFCSASSCRDLLFHVQEVAFTLDRLAAALAALDLEFLGFELFDPALRAAFQARFPGPGALRDLARWAAFEADNPDAFRTMYQFWCRPR